MQKSLIGQSVELMGRDVTVRKKKSFLRREECFSFAFDTIVKMEAVQIDLFTIDMVALAVYLQNRYYEIYEDAQGYNFLLKALEENFGPFPEGWYSDVTRTVFEENRVLLWKKYPNNNIERTS